ncbi:MAG: hypothetical protein ED556_08540 [Winogradskyella sp.]|nr:MAG: hypothetical protein ED556_08540 [Winogradskyella sp.]
MGLKDKPKQIEITTSYKFYGRDAHKSRKGKTSHTFNKKGRLIMTQVDSLANDSTAIPLKTLMYKFTGKNTRVILDKKTGDTLKIEAFKQRKDNTMVLISKSEQTKPYKQTNTNMLVFNSDFQHLETNDTTRYNGEALDMTIMMNQEYSYDGAERTGITVKSTQKTNSEMFGERHNPGNTSKFTYRNYSYDTQGNYTYREMQDNLGRAVLIEERTIIYR